MALADRYRMIPSELARRLTVREFREIHAYHTIMRRRRQEATDD